MNSVTFDLSEFDRHNTHLQQVCEEVAVAQQAVQAGMTSNGDAFGSLFGWAVAPALNAICGGVSTYSADLGQLLSVSAQGIARDRADYAQAEAANAEAARIISVEASTGPAVK